MFLSSPLAPFSWLTLHPASPAANARPAAKAAAPQTLFRIMAIALLPANTSAFDERFRKSLCATASLEALVTRSVALRLGFARQNAAVELVNHSRHVGRSLAVGRDAAVFVHRGWSSVRSEERRVWT